MELNDYENGRKVVTFQNRRYPDRVVRGVIQKTKSNRIYKLSPVEVSWDGGTVFQPQKRALFSQKNFRMLSDSEASELLGILD